MILVLFCSVSSHYTMDSVAIKLHRHVIEITVILYMGKCLNIKNPKMHKTGYVRHQEKHNCNFNHLPLEGTNLLNVKCRCLWNHWTSFSPVTFQKALVVAFNNKGALEVNNNSWENLLAWHPLCCWGHSVVPAIWASALVAYFMPLWANPTESSASCTALCTGFAEHCDLCWWALRHMTSP